jgi:hypothetical protein
VATGEGEGGADPITEADGVALGDADAAGDVLGVGEGGMIFTHSCNGTLAPPISLTSISQRERIFSKSGGPNGLSAVYGNMMYVTFKSLTGRL